MLPSSQLVLHYDEQHAPHKSLALLCTCPLCPSSTPTLRPALPGHPICLRWPLQLLCQGQLLLLFCSAKHAHVKTKVFFQQQTVHKMSLSRKLYIATEAAAAALTSHAPVGLCLPITQFPPSLLQNTLPSRGKFPFNVRLLSSLAFCKGFKLLQHSNLTISFAKHSHFVSGSERSGAPSRDNSLSSSRAWIAAIRRA